MAKTKETSIVKPEKVLREGLAKQKASLEKKGWTITEIGERWRAEKKFTGEPFTTKIAGAISIKQIIETAERFELQQKKVKELSPDAVVAIETARIVPSPFEPQARRRRRFKDADIESLGNSIENHGLAQPIVVRPATGGKFEIVFGERRFLAARVKNLKTINSFVRELSDAQTLELQSEENHRRVDNDPLDDAFFFKFLKEKEGYTDEQLADRLNTSRKNVTDKLKLNDLIVPAVAELNEGKLPLKHAIYLAKFSAPVQEEIVREQYAYKYRDRTEAAASYAEFKEEVEENILRRLENSPFDKEDDRLHIKGLICANCTERTGFTPALFTDVSRGDSCLNKSCFEVKTNTHLRLQRDAIAEARPNPTNAPLDEIAADVPLVTDRKYTQDERTPFREKTLTNQKFLPEPECSHSVASLIVEGARKGEQTFICKSDACEIHNPKPVLSESELRQKEAEFNRKVEIAAREKVFAKAIEFFDDYKPLWMFDDLIQKLLIELWRFAGAETAFDARKPILRVIKNWKGIPFDYSRPEEVEKFIASLNKRKQSQLLFLLIFKTEGFYPHDNQDGIKKLCTDYAGTDYRVLFAEARHELAPPEEKELAADILTITRAGVNDLRAPDFDLSDRAAH